MTPCPHRPPHLLIAEDEEAIALLLLEAMEEAGLRATLARDGLDALDRLGRQRFDLLLTDIRMPRLGGVDLVRALWQRSSRMPVIVLSGYMTPKDATDLRALGVRPEAILSKPTGLAQVVEAVLTALHASDATPPVSA
ncbi:response regulator [Roseomonas sp. CCTCC AB2023176]|uniref:response regulator n=1 Tax=Roseomonas sp. CCTCC AB2023176 TaxID=3342640 RepID=UPI0035D776EE